MENNGLLNYEEIKCIKNMHRYAALAKYSLIAVCISCLLLFLTAVIDFIQYTYNVTRNTLMWVIALLIVITILLVIWAIYFVILKKNISKNKTWNDILEKFSNKKKLNAELKKIDANNKSYLSVYILGNFVSKCDELKNAGNIVKTMGGIAMIFMIMRYCSIVIDFTKTISKIYNIRLKFNVKLCFVLCMLPTLILLICEIVSTVYLISLGNAKKEEIINRLTKNCAQTSYYELDHYSNHHGDDEITLVYREKYTYVSSTIGLDENRDIEDISVYFRYDKSTSKQEIIDNSNLKLKQLNDLLKMSEINGKYSFLCEKYELSENFINKFNATSLEKKDNIDDEYGLENSYTVDTTAYVPNDTDITISFKINVNYLF